MGQKNDDERHEGCGPAQLTRVQHRLVDTTKTVEASS